MTKEEIKELIGEAKTEVDEIAWKLTRKLWYDCDDNSLTEQKSLYNASRALLECKGTLLSIARSLDSEKGE